MDCAFDDDLTIVVTMVDFAISDKFGLIYSKKLIARKPIFPTVLIVELSDFKTGLYLNGRQVTNAT